MKPTPAAPPHTPTPWHLDNEGRTVVGADGIQICTPHGLRHPQPAVNAAFIVRAVNTHEELLRVCKLIYETENERDAFCPDWMTDLKEAIAKAEKGEWPC